VGTLLTDVLKTPSCQHAAAAETLLDLTGDMLQLSAIVVRMTSSLYLVFSALTPFGPKSGGVYISGK